MVDGRNALPNMKSTDCNHPSILNYMNWCTLYDTTAARTGDTWIYGAKFIAYYMRICGRHNTSQYPNSQAHIQHTYSALCRTYAADFGHRVMGVRLNLSGARVCIYIYIYI